MKRITVNSNKIIFLNLKQFTVWKKQLKNY